MPAPERIGALTLVPRPGAPSIAFLFASAGAQDSVPVSGGCVFGEARALLGLGREVRLYPLGRRGRPSIGGRLGAEWEKGPLVARIRDRSCLSPGFLRSVVATAFRHPLRLGSCLFDLVRGHWQRPRTLLRALGILPTAIALGRDMQSEGVAHVHADSVAGAGLLAASIHRLVGIPFSFTCHGAASERIDPRIEFLLARATFAVVTSEHARRCLLEQAGAWAAPKLHLVRHGLNLQDRSSGSEPKPASETPSATPGSSPLNILCVADCAGDRKQSVLLDALALLADHAVPFRCCSLGREAERASFGQRTVELGLVGKVHFLALGASAESFAGIQAELQGADVVVCAAGTGDLQRTSSWLLQAMSLACPVIACASPPTREMVTDGVEGFLLPAGDAAALALALTRLWECPDLREQLGLAGRARIASEFDLASHALTLAQLFDESLGPRPHKRPRRPRLVAS